MRNTASIVLTLKLSYGGTDMTYYIYTKGGSILIKLGMAGKIVNNNMDDLIEHYKLEREKRVNNFINYLHDKRIEFVNSLSTID